MSYSYNIVLLISINILSIGVHRFNFTILLKISFNINVYFANTISNLICCISWTVGPFSIFSFFWDNFLSKINLVEKKLRKKGRYMKYILYGQQSLWHSPPQNILAVEGEDHGFYFPTAMLYMIVKNPNYVIFHNFFLTVKFKINEEDVLKREKK